MQQAHNTSNLIKLNYEINLCNIDESLDTFMTEKWQKQKYYQIWIQTEFYKGNIGF